MDFLEVFTNWLNQEVDHGWGPQKKYCPIRKGYSQGRHKASCVFVRATSDPQMATIYGGYCDTCSYTTTGLEFDGECSCGINTSYELEGDFELGAMRMHFDPNLKHKPVVPPYATYIQNRSPQFKIHTNVGHAKNAINGSGRGIIYQLIDGEWVEIDRHEPQTQCAHCEQPFQRSGWRRSYTLYKHPATPAYKKPEVCEDCYYEHFISSAKNPIAHKFCGLVSPLG